MKDMLVTAVLLLLLVAGVALDSIGLLPAVSLAQWETVASIFWALLPFLLCLLLAVCTKALSSLWPAVLVHLESNSALRTVMRTELETRAAMNDALMWQARHSAKAARKAS